VAAFADFKPATPAVTVKIAARKNLLVTFMGYSSTPFSIVYELFMELLKLYFLNNFR
jgi:hypothetical protein